jgi:excisionase family DNA binding protein
MPNPEITDSDLLSAEELAKKLKRHYRTVLRWARDGLIPVEERIGRGHIRFKYSAVKAQMQANSIRI